MCVLGQGNYEIVKRPHRDLTNFLPCENTGGRCCPCDKVDSDPEKCKVHFYLWHFVTVNSDNCVGPGEMTQQLVILANKPDKWQSIHGTSVVR